jgi:hypothetical protein
MVKLWPSAELEFIDVSSFPMTLNICPLVRQCNTFSVKYSVLNECSRMLKYNIFSYDITIMQFPDLAIIGKR